VKPLFIFETDVFGSDKPNPPEFITHNEIYKAIGEQVSASFIKGRPIGKNTKLRSKNE